MSGSSKGKDFKNATRISALIEFVALTMISRFYNQQKSCDKLKQGGVFPPLNSTLVSVKVSWTKSHIQKSGFTEVSRLQGFLRLLGLVVPICLVKLLKYFSQQIMQVKCGTAYNTGIQTLFIKNPSKESCFYLYFITLDRGQEDLIVLLGMSKNESVC